MKTGLETAFHRAANLIAGADALVVAAGAGIGVDSGLPDFRGSEGFWRAYPALGAARLSFSEVANPRSFRDDPTLAWGFYGHRLILYRKTAPHQGFSLLKKWARRGQLGAWIFTSNVDGQFQRAGYLENQIHECHGSIHYLQCIQACDSDIWSADGFTPEVDEQACRLISKLPRCPSCGGVARPNIAMFGDWDWRGERRDEQIGRQEVWFEKVARARANVVVIEIGAGTAVPSVRNFSQRISAKYGARLIRINPSQPEVSDRRDVAIAAGSLVALQAIDERLSASSR